ncbi:type I-E CRISPR-associated protein Cse2/CasB [Streptomyces sp. NPDC089919]|uniref:type I-E CRISPR-associated protein Cse2/CasB n=1 Tax=Streptomyces sp. NPDC089919 TaxID=3155188 RepID=UPI0034483FC7
MTSTKEEAVPYGLQGQDRRRAFTTHVASLCAADPGARAALRGGLGRPVNDKRLRAMDRLVARWLPEGEPMTEDTEWAYYAVASMIAATTRRSQDLPEEAEEGATPSPDPAGAPGSDSDAEPSVASVAASGSDQVQEPVGSPVSAGRYGTSLGAAFAVAVASGPGREREMREGTAESRLNLLTRQSVPGLHRHLPGTVRYLRDLDVEVDWGQLLGDLIFWRRSKPRIARRWLQDYYRLRDRQRRADADQRDQEDQASQAAQVQGAPAVS